MIFLSKMLIFGSIIVVPKPNGQRQEDFALSHFTLLEMYNMVINQCELQAVSKASSSNETSSNFHQQCIINYY